MDDKGFSSATTGNAEADKLHRRILLRQARIGVVGLGYVGLPLTIAISKSGFEVTGFDVDHNKVEMLNVGRSYIHHIPSAIIADLVAAKRFHSTADFADIAALDVVLICVPTPLTPQREPDLSYIVDTTEAIAPYLKPGQLIVLESTTYPGTTRDVMKPILEKSGLKSDVDFFLAYSPEREDPGNAEYDTARIPKVVGGDGSAALSLTLALYNQFVASTVPVSNIETAEAVKLTENIFRAVNIALVNELKLIFEAMGIDVWEVIEAAKTKPFGYMPFYPGPGLGGHCIPIDPFYLTWKAREHGITTRFIELAGEINTAMPHHVVEKLVQALNDRQAKSLKGAKILLIGLAYKKNVNDTRESPSLKLMELLEARGAKVSYHDPLVPEILPLREHPEFVGRRSVPLDAAALKTYDAALICTDHDGIDYRLISASCPLVIDTRNAYARIGLHTANIVKA